MQGEVPEAGRNLSAAGGDAWMFSQLVLGCVLLFALVPQESGCSRYICTERSGPKQRL